MPSAPCTMPQPEGAMTLNDTWYLKRASQYARPLDGNAVLPVVYGDLTDGSYGVWEAPCIDTLNKVYCFAAHAVRTQTIQVWVKVASVDPSQFSDQTVTDSNGDTSTVNMLTDPAQYSSGDVLIDPSRYTFNASNNYESKGNIATITFTDDLSNAVIIVKGVGKNDSGSNLMENPVDIIDDILTVENTFTSALYNTTTKATAREKCVKHGYRAAGVINADVVLWDLIQQLLSCFLGSAYYDANKELVIDIDDNTAMYAGAPIIPQRHIDFESAVQDLENLVNECPAIYRFNYTAGKYSAYDDGLTYLDAPSQAIYGVKKPESTYEFPWCRHEATVNKIQQIIVEKFKDPLWIVDIKTRTLAYHHLDVGDIVCCTIKDLYGKDLNIQNKQSGSVTLANMRLSLVNGAAFVDISSAGALTPHIGKLITVTDSAGKKITGYIKAAGTGETLGSELVTGWTNDARTGFDFETLTTSGKEISSAVNSSARGQAYSNAMTTPQGKCFKREGVLTLNSGTAPTWGPNQGSTPFVGAVYNALAMAAGANSDYYTGSAQAGNMYLWLYVVTGVATNFAISGMSVKHVLTPSATGVTIVSTQGGAAQNWASIETGFNYNDASGYTYEITQPEVDIISEYINQFFKIVSVKPDLTKRAVNMTLHDTGKYLTGDNAIADGTYLADGSIMAGNNTRDINEY